MVCLDIKISECHKMLLGLLVSAMLKRVSSCECLVLSFCEAGLTSVVVDYLVRQTPTFNAKPIVAACVDACRRGIQVTIYVDLGFNDKGESMPFQGGTNEQVVERMYKDLARTNDQKNLHVYWYTSKDQIRPLNAVKKQRNCHVKVSSYRLLYFCCSPC